MPDAVMLFAAGFGTRMKELTKDRPKPLIEVAGIPLIEHAMRFVRDAGIGTVVVNAHYKAAQIERHFADSDVTVLVETPKILDTGGGLKAALPQLQAKTVFTMNTDAVWRGPNPLDVLSKAWDDTMSALLLCVPKTRAVGHAGGGDFAIDAHGKADWGRDVIYTGVQIIRTECVSNVPENVFSLKDVWKELIAQNALSAVEYPGHWCDVGHPGGITLAEDMLSDADV